MTTSSNSETRLAKNSSLSTKLARRLVFSILSKLKSGCLEIVTPEGQHYTFGNGGSVSAVIRVFDEEFFLRCILFADLGLAESYLDGLIEISSIESVISLFLLNQHESPVLNESPVLSPLMNLLGFINIIEHSLKPNSKRMSKRNISDHYDLGNNFFQLFLDESMTYSSGLFLSKDTTLAQAQEAKFERLAKMLKIQAADRVLEVGCGWGAFACYLAKKYGCKITGLTISQQQYQYATQRVKEEKLEQYVEIRLEDYRDHKGSYDKIASIEMIEAVGDAFMDTFFAKLDSLLAKDGILGMQMITSADSRYEMLKTKVDFIQKHIFPGSLLPSLHRINRATLSCGELFLVDLFDMSSSYAITLKKWQDAFEENLDQVRSIGFDERFIRKWKYYFEYCRAAFAMRNVSVVQAIYSRPNNPNLAGGVRLND